MQNKPIEQQILHLNPILLSDINLNNTLFEESTPFTIVYRQSDKSGYWTYYDYENQILKNNLRMVESSLDELVADSAQLVQSAGGNLSSSEVASLLATANRMGFHHSEKVYAHRIKSLLWAIASGINAQEEWAGKYRPLTTSDGSPICQFVYQANQVKEYLFSHSQFELVEPNIHGLGTPYTGEGGGEYIKLNLQIRFKK